MFPPISFLYVQCHGFILVLDNNFNIIMTGPGNGQMFLHLEETYFIVEVLMSSSGLSWVFTIYILVWRMFELFEYR